MSTTPEQLRLAADILEKGLEWEYTDRHGHTWDGSSRHDIPCLLAAGLPIRLKSPDPYAELKAAHAAGKAIQFRGKGDEKWYNCGPDTGNGPQWLDGYEYRIKPEPEPEPEYVALDASDVPLSATFQRIGWHQLRAKLMVERDTCGIMLIDSDGEARWKHWKELFDGWQISRDGGKTWHPCRKVKEGA
jgi:hypothetical protein